MYTHCFLQAYSFLCISNNALMCSGNRKLGVWPVSMEVRGRPGFTLIFTVGAAMSSVELFCV